VVDVLALRGELGPALGPLLANPAVEKVLHGADSDVLWLQVRRRGAGAVCSVWEQAVLCSRRCCAAGDVAAKFCALIALVMMCIACHYGWCYPACCVCTSCLAAAITCPARLLIDPSLPALQRDFGLYLVNMFDTGQAARLLCYPSASLAYLLERHCGFKPDKRCAAAAGWGVLQLQLNLLATAWLCCSLLCRGSSEVPFQLVCPMWAGHQLLCILATVEPVSLLKLCLCPHGNQLALCCCLPPSHPPRRYQLADWRVRPLPLDMLHYARADTHFLLAAADALRAELAAAGARVPEGYAVQVPAHSGAGQVRLAGPGAAYSVEHAGFLLLQCAVSAKTASKKPRVPSQMRSLLLCVHSPEPTAAPALIAGYAWVSQLPSFACAHLQLHLFASCRMRWVWCWSAPASSAPPPTRSP
jgi:hypothetical protein